MIRKLLNITLIAMIPLLVLGQKGWELGAGIGASEYFGDLHTELNVQNPNIAAGINVRYNFDERIALKSSFNYTTLYGTDESAANSFELNRGLHFKSPIADWTNQIEFNFLKYKHGSEDHWTPYLLGGFSILSFNPRAQPATDGPTYNLRLYGTEGQALGEEYGRFTTAFVYGMGAKWDINYNWSINAELSIRTANSDYLDDVSSFYPNLMELQELRGHTAVRLSDPTGISETHKQRGNDRQNDSYAIFSISIMRYFGRLECPNE